MMNNLIICGYSGSGKSVIGRSTAELLGFSFAETTERMLSVTGYTPAQVIKKYGIIRYHSEEELIFKKLAALQNTVIAVDTLMPEADRLMILKQSGFFVFLRVDADLLFRRLQKRNRQKISFTDLAEKIANYEAIYLPLCDFVLTVGECGIENAAAIIIKNYQEYVENETQGNFV